MSTIFETRYASSPQEVKKLDTQELRDEFLIPDLMEVGKIKLTYTHYDRYVAGGAVPTSPLTLETIAPLKADYFLERREMGIINAGGSGSISVDGAIFKM
ncbi:MAG: 4-deoxy-L-threo-5-hexosulose-uronate ketol-isomerase, partial [Psychroserpens sp.]